MTPWTCSECGIGIAEANKKRRRLGVGPLRSIAKTCTVQCARARERRYLRERYGPRSGQVYPLPPGWRCAICGCDEHVAQARRRELGLGVLESKVKTCSPDCARELRQQLFPAVTLTPVSRRWQEYRRSPEVIQAKVRAARAGAKMRRARLSKGLSLRGLAARVGVSQSYISKIESGTLAGRPALLKKIAKILGVQVMKP